MKRDLGIGILRLVGEFTFGFVLTAVIIAGLNLDANATIIKTSTRTVNNGSADFGSGNHSGGGPSGPATITFDWSTATGTFVATGRVQGTLYWDALWSGGCTRLVIRFRNSAGTSLRTRTIDECGPGGDANNLANRTGVDDSFSTGGDLADIRITVAELVDGTSVNAQSFTFTHPTDLQFPLLVENGRADFGDGNHSFGAPEESGFVRFRRNLNGTVTGGVDGILYKDAIFQPNFGCSTIEITYRNSSGAVLDTFGPQMNCGPGGDANLAANQFFVNDGFSSGSLAQIRVLVDSTFQDDRPELWKFNFAGQF